MGERKSAARFLRRQAREECHVRFAPGNPARAFPFQASRSVPNNLHIHRLDGGYHDNNIDAYVTLCVEHHRVAEQHTDRDRNDQQEAEPKLPRFLERRCEIPA